MEPLIDTLLWLILKLLDIYLWVIIVWVVSSWLVAFHVINVQNPLVKKILHILEILTEPVFKPLRKIIPPLGGLDLSPMVVVLGIIFLQRLIVAYWARSLY